MTHRLGMATCGLVTAALLALPGPLAGQTTLGISAGATFATFEGDNASDDVGTRTGLMVGAHLGFPLGEIITLVPGAYYVQKGAESDEGAGSVSLDYIEIPVLLSVSVVPPERPFGLNLFAGPEVAFKVSCSVDGSGGEGDCPENAFKGTDFGLIAGAGLGFGRFFVNGGIDLGLTSIDDTDGDFDVKNSVWFVAAGIRFPMGGFGG